MMLGSFFPYGRQTLDDDDIAEVVRALRSDMLTGGPEVNAFETTLAGITGATEAVAVNSGTAALHIAVLAAGLDPGDTAIVPAVTFAATASVCRHAGARVVFADVDPLTGLMTTDTAAEALARAGGTAKVLLPVHLAGQVADPEGMAALAATHDLMVIEDACHALGTTYGGEDGTQWSVGANAHASMTCFSFHPVKTIAMAEGGAVSTNNPALAARLRRLRNHGLERDPEALADNSLAQDPITGSINPWFYEVTEPAFNYRTPDVLCALGRSQLGKLPRFLTARRKLMDTYDAALAPLAPIVRPTHRVAACRPGWHLCAVRIDFAAAGLTRATLMERLREAGVGTQVHYIPLHWQPAFRQEHGGGSLPGAEAYYAATLSLPLFPAMQEEDVHTIVDRLAAALELH